MPQIPNTKQSIAFLTYAGETLRRLIGRGSTSVTQLTLFAKTMAVTLRSGVTIMKALSLAEDAARGHFKQVVKGIMRSVESGRSLSDSLSLYSYVFSDFFINTVKVGEASGTLTVNLEHLALQLDKERALRGKIKAAAFYPLVVVIAAVILGVFAAVFVLPKIIPLIKSLQVELPFTTRVLIWLVDAASRYGLALLIGGLLFFFFLGWLLRQSFAKPTIHWLLLHIPVVRFIVRDANLIHFARTLGMLIKSGVPIGETMGIVKSATANYYYRQAVDDVGRSIAKGTKLSQALLLHENLFPRLFTHMLEVAEESGRLDEMLLYFADFYEEDLDNAAKALSTTIEPLLLLSIGVVVAFLALSIITPIYSVTGGIGR